MRNWAPTSYRRKSTVSLLIVYLIRAGDLIRESHNLYPGSRSARHANRSGRLFLELGVPQAVVSILLSLTSCSRGGQMAPAFQ